MKRFASNIFALPSALACLFILVLVFSSCERNKPFQFFADKVNAWCLKEVRGIRSVNTIYMLTDTLCRSNICIVQAAECLYAGTEAAQEMNADSAMFREMAYQYILRSKSVDSTTLELFRTRSVIYYTLKDGQKGCAEITLYFNELRRMVPKYEFIKKFAKENNERIQYEPYEEVTPKQEMAFKNMGLTKFSY